MGLCSVITASAYACLWLCPSLGEKSGFSRHTQFKFMAYLWVQSPAVTYFLGWKKKSTYGGRPGHDMFLTVS